MEVFGVLWSFTYLVWYQQPQKICILLFVAFLMIAYIIGYTVATGHPSKENTEYFAAEVMQITGQINISSVGYLGGPVWFGDEMNIPIVLNVVNWIIFIFAVSTIVVTIIYKILAEIRRVSDQFDAKMEYQKRLFIVLLLQTFFPVMFTFTPPLLAFVFSVLRINIGAAICEMTAVFSFAQIIDPILLLALVTDYRRAVQSMFRQIFPKIAPATSSTITQEPIVA